MSYVNANIISCSLSSYTIQRRKFMYNKTIKTIFKAKKKMLVMIYRLETIF